MFAECWGSPSTLGAARKWYLLFELLGGMVVDQGEGEGDGVVVPHQCEQHPRVGGGADLSHDLYFPGCFSPDVWRHSCCDEGGTSGSNTNEGKMRVSKTVPATAPCPALGGTHAGLAAEARRKQYDNSVLNFEEAITVRANSP